MVPPNMNRFTTTVMLLAASILSASAAPRVALVRVKDIYSGLVSTATLQSEIKAERDAIMKDQRAVELRRIIDELQALQTRLSDKNNPLDEATNRKLARSYEIKRQEAQTLQKEFESFRSEQEKQINRKMVTGMRASLNRITETSMKLARERGYDIVFDESGNTNTSVPFVLYHKKAPDLTDNVKAALADAGEPSQPAGEQADPAKTSQPPEP
jgi:Skp family chaperone for outer membrane proteins